MCGNAPVPIWTGRPKRLSLSANSGSSLRVGESPRIEQPQADPAHALDCPSPSSWRSTRRVISGLVPTRPGRWVRLSTGGSSKNSARWRARIFQDAAATVLVEEAFDPLDRLVERGPHRVDRSEGEGDIRGAQSANLCSGPLRDRALGHGEDSTLECWDAMPE